MGQTAAHRSGAVLYRQIAAVGLPSLTRGLKREDKRVKTAAEATVTGGVFDASGRVWSPWWCSLRHQSSGWSPSSVKTNIYIRVRISLRLLTFDPAVEDTAWTCFHCKFRHCKLLRSDVAAAVCLWTWTRTRMRSRTRTRIRVSSVCVQTEMFETSDLLLETS